MRLPKGLTHQKGNKYLARFRVFDPAIGEKIQKSKRITAETPDEAERLFDEWKAELRRQYLYYQDADKITLNDIFAVWQDECNRRIQVGQMKWKTFHETYKKPAENILYALGDKEPDKVTRNDLQRAFDYIMDEHDKYSNTHIHYHLKVLKMLYSFAINNQLASINVPNLHYNDKSKKYGLILPKKTNVVVNPMDIDLINKILNETKDHYLLHTLCFFALNTGMRRSELLGLDRRKVNLSKKTIAINKQLEKIKGGGNKFELTDLKSDYSNRTITIDDATAAALEKHYWITEEQKKLVGEGYKDKVVVYDKENEEHIDFYPVFAKETGELLDPNLVTKWFRKLLGKLAKDTQHDLRKHRFHDLRHTFASHMIEAGVKAEDVSQILGHHSVAFTQKTYIHQLNDAKKRAAEKYGKYKKSYPIQSVFT